MPSKSEKQRRLMAAAAANPAVARKAGIPQRVAKEYRRRDRISKALKGRKRK